MKRKGLIGLVVVFVIAALVLWSFQVFPIASTSELSISFVGYRGAGEKRVAVFRVTNSSAKPYSYAGKMPTTPNYFYRVADGSGWREMVPTKSAIYDAWQTLAPHSSIEFTTPPPTAKNAFAFVRPLREVRNYSSPPPTGAAFTVVMNFMPGDGPTVQADWVAQRMAIADRVRIETRRIIRISSLFLGFDNDTVHQLVELPNYSRGEWIASNPAPVQ